MRAKWIRESPRGLVVLAMLAIVLVVAASAMRVVILAPGGSASPNAVTSEPPTAATSATPPINPLPSVTAANSTAPTPFASGPLPGGLPGFAYLSGSSAWMRLESDLAWSDDTGRTWTHVAYPIGVTYDRVEAVATAPGRPLWLAVPSSDGYRLYRKTDVAAAWSSVLLTPPAALLRTGGSVFNVQLIPGPGRMITVAETMADLSGVLFVSNDDGESFVRHRTPTDTQANMNWAWSTFTTPTSGVVINVSRGGPEFADPFVHTSDGGTIWSDAKFTGLPAKGSYNLGTPRLVGSDIEVPVAACGADCSTGGLLLLVSHDGGVTFNPLGGAMPYGENPPTVSSFGGWVPPAFDSLGSVTWVSTGGGIIEETADGGQTWTAVKAEGLPRGFNSFAELELTGTTSATAVVSADGQAGNVFWIEEYLLATTDGGRTWTLV